MATDLQAGGVWARRRVRARSMAAAQGCDGLLVIGAANVRYLSGFSGSSGWLVLGGQSSWLIVDRRYQEQGAREAPGVTIQIAPIRLLETLRDVVSGAELSKLAVEGEHTSVNAHRELLEVLPGTAVEVLVESLDALRSRKDSGEVEAIRAALAMTEEALAAVFDQLVPGQSERQVAAELEYACRLRGADGMAFDTIVASGPRAALPHGLATDRVLRQQEPITIDCGIRLGGYCSDLTRTTWLGGVPKSWSEHLRVVLAALETGIGAIRAGVEGRSVDAAARQVVVDAGLGDCFLHGLGHGLGLEVHEPPRVSPTSDCRLESGMVLTVEPGMYFPGCGGIRVEDMVLVTPEGCERLNRLEPMVKTA